MEVGDNSDDSDYRCLTKMGPKRKKMMMRKQSWKQERISSEGKNSQLGEYISKMVKFMRKKQKSVWEFPNLSLYPICHCNR